LNFEEKVVAGRGASPKIPPHGMIAWAWGPKAGIGIIKEHALCLLADEPQDTL
jgi:hypothetical protein